MLDSVLLGELKALLPTLVVGGAVLASLTLRRRVLRKRGPATAKKRLRQQLNSLGLYLAGLVLVILTLPGRGDLLNLLGLLLSAAFTLSSTTLVGNAMAGLMLRSLRNFQPGDFLQVGDHFGRVSERGLFHVEIQTVDRDLTTLPNTYLITHPVKVVRADGTIVSATVSLGYDVSRKRVEPLLIEAAERAGLGEAFVQVVELGDYSVVYRIAGNLKDTRALVSSRARLRANMLDALHGGGVEIVSPMFMNQRLLPTREQVVPTDTPPHGLPALKVAPAQPEDMIFDKADQAAARAVLERELDTLRRRVAELGAELSEAKGDRLKAVLSYRLEQINRRVEQVREMLTEAEAEG